MKNVQNILTAAALLIGMSMTQITADDSLGKEELTTKSEIQVLDKKIEDIQKQIDALESKGFENLSIEERVKLDELLDKLLAAQKEKTAKQKEINKALQDRILDKLDTIEKSLSSKSIAK